MFFIVSERDFQKCSMYNHCVKVCWLCFWAYHSQDPLEYFNREVQKRRDEETNLWSTPGDPSHSEREDDRVLYSLLQARNKTRMGSTVCEFVSTVCHVNLKFKKNSRWF